MVLTWFYISMHSSVCNVLRTCVLVHWPWKWVTIKMYNSSHPSINTQVTHIFFHLISIQPRLGVTGHRPQGNNNQQFPPLPPHGTAMEDLPGFDPSTGDIWIYPTNYPVRDYQYNIVQQALFKNTMVTLPTGETCFHYPLSPHPSSPLSVIVGHKASNPQFPPLPPHETLMEDLCCFDPSTGAIWMYPTYSPVRDY